MTRLAWLAGLRRDLLPGLSASRRRARARPRLGCSPGWRPRRCCSACTASASAARPGSASWRRWPRTRPSCTGSTSSPSATGTRRPSWACWLPSLSPATSRPSEPLFGAGAALFARAGVASPFAVALLWTALDHLRSFALTGFPWATLGYAQHLNPALLPLASLGGVYALSFLSVLGGASLARVVRLRKLDSASASGLAAVALAHAVGLGISAAEPDEAGLPRLRVAVLQGNIDQGVKWSSDWAESTLRIYEDLSRRAAAQGARLIVWPETAVPGAIDPGRDEHLRFERLARETGAALVVGAVGLELGPQADAGRRHRQRLRVRRLRRARASLRQDASGAVRRVRAAPGPVRPPVPRGGARDRRDRRDARASARAPSRSRCRAPPPS